MQLRLIGRMPLGREDVKLQWEVAPLGTPFTATTVISGTSAEWTDVLTTGVVITQKVSGLTSGTAYHWRARLLYRSGNRLGQSASRWVHVPWNGWTEQDFRTPVPIAGLDATNDSPTALDQPTTLTATVTAGSNVAYEWALGDGSTGSGPVVTHTYPAANVYMAVVTASNSVSVFTATTSVTVVPPVVRYTYDPLNRLTSATYSGGERFEYAYDEVGNRTAMTSTTTLSGTVVTTYIYDDANRLTDRAVSDGRVYTYTWSARRQLLAEWTQGSPVRTFAYDGAGQMVEATVFTLTTRFTYNGLGARIAVEVEGQGTTTYTLDYAGGNGVLAEHTVTGTMLYLYGRDCLGQFADDEWLYYLHDAAGQVRQTTNEQGQVVSTWLYDPDGTVLEGPEGPVSHLVCGGIYDWSTGLIYKDGRYFDPVLGIWLALTPLVVVQLWRGRKKSRRRFPWYVLVLFVVWMGGLLTACGPSPSERKQLEQLCVEMPTPGPPADCTAMPTTGAEPPYEPERWNDCGTIQFSNNCYSYAANDPDGHEYGCKPQPGVASGRPWNAGATTLIDAYQRVTCDNITDAAIADAFMSIGCDVSCLPGSYKAALVVDPYEGDYDSADYHWYRQDQGGCWSSKPGHWRVTNLDVSGSVISDPRVANRNYGPAGGPNYSQFCGCFCVPQGGIQTSCP